MSQGQVATAVIVAILLFWLYVRWWWMNRRL